jgi:hypothetical protein
LRRVELIKASQVKVKPFKIADFIQTEERNSSIKKVSKKELRSLAKNLGLTYDDTQIVFAKKLITAYLNK